MFEFFAFFTFWFWFLVAVALVAIVTFIEFDKFLGATTVFIITGFLLYFGGNAPEFKSLFAYIKDNPANVLVFAICYVIMGVIWSIVKYYFYLRAFKDKYEDAKKAGTHLDRFADTDAKYVKPNMEKIMIWMVWWIPSMLWTMVNDPIRRFFRWVYYRIVGVYDIMYKKMIGDILAEQEAANEKRNR